jgi:hypothetical protein
MTGTSTVSPGDGPVFTDLTTLLGTEESQTSAASGTDSAAPSEITIAWPDADPTKIQATVVKNIVLLFNASLEPDANSQLVKDAKVIRYLPYGSTHHHEADSNITPESSAITPQEYAPGAKSDTGSKKSAITRQQYAAAIARFAGKTNKSLIIDTTNAPAAPLYETDPRVHHPLSGELTVIGSPEEVFKYLPNCIEYQNDDDEWVFPKDAGDNFHLTTVLRPSTSGDGSGLNRALTALAGVIRWVSPTMPQPSSDAVMAKPKVTIHLDERQEPQVRGMLQASLCPTGADLAFCLYTIEHLPSADTGVGGDLAE